MKKFWGYVSNGKFSVGCTGQTVYIYDKDNNEIGKHKDIIYGYTPMISPDGSLFVVKSTIGKLAVYSLETFLLIKKFRFSKVDGCQDDGFCFSPDGSLFMNIERHEDSLHTAISIYSTRDFSLVKRIYQDENMVLSHIEYDFRTKSNYVLGFMRNEDGVLCRCFVGKFEDYQIKEITDIPETEYHFFVWYKHLELLGFTEKAYEWTYIDCSLDELKNKNCTLADLYFSNKK